MRLLVTILIAFLPNTVTSQDLVSAASDFLNEKNYSEAKRTIDEAFDKGGQKQNARAWYTRGRIYHEILSSEDATVSAIVEDKKAFTQEIVDSYNQTRSLSDPGANLYKLATNQLEILWAYGINTGYGLFQNQKFDAATSLFELAQIAKPADTTGYLFAGFSLQNAGKFEKAISHYLELKKLKPLSLNVYNNLIICEQGMNAPLEKRLDLIEEAIFHYPDHIPYISEEVRILVKIGKYEEAESRLNTVLKKFPNSYELRLRRADLFDLIFKYARANGQPDRSQRYFEMASDDYQSYLKKFPNDFTANYNYSVMLNEQANQIYDQVNLLNDEDYQIRGKEMEEKGHEWTRKALPYMEKAYSLNRNDKLVVRALKVYYERLKMQDKLDKLNQN